MALESRSCSGLEWLAAIIPNSGGQIFRPGMSGWTPAVQEIESGRVQLVYKRRNGGVGLLKPTLVQDL